MDWDIGKTGVVVLLVVFLALFAEDLYVWIVAGVVPGIEFFAGVVLVVVVGYFAIRAAKEHPPPRH